MIKALELENFKAFGERIRVEFAPITLIFGENSAGKSCILQALSLLKQTQESRQHAPLLLRAAQSGIVDLGSYRDVIFDHDVSRRLTIRIDIAASGGMEGCVGDAAMEISFAPRAEGGIDLKSLIVLDPQTGERLARFEAMVRPEGAMSVISDEGPSWLFSPERVTTGLECVGITDSREYWAPKYARVQQSAENIVAHLHAEKETLESRGKISGVRESGNRRDDNEFKLEAVDDAIRFYSRDFSLNEFMDRMQAMELGAVVELDGLSLVGAGWRTWRCERGFAPKIPVFVELRDTVDGSVKMCGPFMTAFREAASIDVVCRIRDFFDLLQDYLRRLRPIGPYRQPPQRWYASSGSQPNEVGSGGEMLPELLFRKPELLSEVNEYLDQLKVGYHVTVKAIGEPSRELFEVCLVDRRRRRELEVAIRDVGFGVSQILPFVVQCVAGDFATIIAIEQPELHIHPRLQADIGDLLIHAISRVEGTEDEGFFPANNRFIVETHSEHLILRLLRRIRETREGTLPAGHPGLTPEDVSVIYVERGEAGSKVRRLRIDETGEFIDPWPHGFFEERARELF